MRDESALLREKENHGEGLESLGDGNREKEFSENYRKFI